MSCGCWGFREQSSLSPRCSSGSVWIWFTLKLCVDLKSPESKLCYKFDAKAQIISIIFKLLTNVQEPLHNSAFLCVEQRYEVKLSGKQAVRTKSQQMRAKERERENKWASRSIFVFSWMAVLFSPTPVLYQMSDIPAADKLRVTDETTYTLRHGAVWLTGTQGVKVTLTCSSFSAPFFSNTVILIFLPHLSVLKNTIFLLFFFFSFNYHVSTHLITNLQKQSILSQNYENVFMVST